MTDARFIRGQIAMLRLDDIVNEAVAAKEKGDLKKLHALRDEAELIRNNVRDMYREQLIEELREAEDADA